MTATATGVFVKVLVGWTFVRLTDTLTRIWVVLIRMLTHWWIFAYTLTRLIVEVLVISALLHIIA